MSFDLKAAREICSRIKGYEDPDGGNFADFQAAEMLPAALDEIERLEAAYLDMWRITLSDKDDNLMPDQLKELNEAANNMLQLQAQAALEKIRRG